MSPFTYMCVSNVNVSKAILTMRIEARECWEITGILFTDSHS